MSAGDIGMQEHVLGLFGFQSSFLTSNPEITNILLLLNLAQNRIERTRPAV
jgi:hypothetical protein